MLLVTGEVKRYDTGFFHQPLFVGEVGAGVVNQLLEDRLDVLARRMSGRQHFAHQIDDVDEMAVLLVHRLDTGRIALIPGKGFHRRSPFQSRRSGRHGERTPRWAQHMMRTVL